MELSPLFPVAFMCFVFSRFCGAYLRQFLTVTQPSMFSRYLCKPIWAIKVVFCFRNLNSVAILRINFILETRIKQSTWAKSNHERAMPKSEWVLFCFRFLSECMYVCIANVLAGVRLVCWAACRVVARPSSRNSSTRGHSAQKRPSRQTSRDHES